MIYVGIDPSTKTGIVALNELGEVIKAKEIHQKGDDPARMFKLIQNVGKEVDIQDNHIVSAICIEDFAYSQGNKMALLGGIGWGIRLYLYEWGYKYINVGTGQLKKFTGAKGNAKKDIIKLETYKRWGFEHDSDNVVDAYVLAQIARSLHEKVELTKFQEEILKKLK